MGLLISAACEALAGFLLRDSVYTAAMSVNHGSMQAAAFGQEQADKAIRLARETLQIEAEAIVAADLRLQGEAARTAFAQAIELLLACRGRVVVSGMGKSGHIARKIAATLASTGTPAMFVHPAEAAHGDLGMVTADDVFIAISYSGESGELLAIVPVVKRMGARMIAMTGNERSNLSQLADVHLDISVDKEACPLNLAPTASTTVTLALGDALAVALLDLRGFKEDDFARSHPGGAFGRKLLTHVRDVMRTGHAIPSVKPDTTLADALLEVTRKGMAMTAVVDQSQHPVGIFTDGDLRRMLEKKQDLTGITVRDLMHPNPRSVSPVSWRWKRST